MDICNNKKKEAINCPAAPKTENCKPAKATFIVQVQYQQNCTWQGQVTWSQKNDCKHFRSELELIKLIDSAAEESKP